MRDLKKQLSPLVNDPKVGPGHLCVYIALLQWQETRPGQRVLFVRRKELMKLAKIRSERTFYKMLRELGEWGYVELEVSRERRGSKVRLGELYAYS